ncbi:hypothetical protein [Bradyrhizobium sp. USDA 336]|uniref:hypothetical protein n=1 Tax=Bradyrhizobium sp. USDA 336 TaxID=3156311 RepID=UPI0038346246
MVAIAALTMTGCSLAPIIEKNSLDYGHTIEQVTNSALAVNVLRGRDQAPLYFPDLSQIRGSLDASVSTSSTIPWSGLGSSQAGPFSASTGPTFDLAPNNTKQFYLGILNPISPKIFAYFVERARGYGSIEPVFHLLVSNIEIHEIGKSSRFLSWADPAPSATRDSAFVELANRLTQKRQPFVASLPGSRRAFGTPVTIAADTTIQAKANGLEIEQAPDGKVQFIRQTPNDTVVCFHDGSGYVAVSFADNSIVKGPGGESEVEFPWEKARACGVGANLRRHYKFHLRSVEQVFNYLGAIVADQDNQRHYRRDGRLEGCPRIPFHIGREPGRDVRFSVEYRGNLYYIHGINNRIVCGDAENGPVDRTLPILAILNSLLNINRDANEVPTTKATQAVGG